MALKDVLPGYRNPLHGICQKAKLLIADAAQVATVPELPARAAAFTGSATDADFTTVSDDFVFVTPLSMGFAEVDIKVYSGNQTGEIAGDIGSRGGQPKLIFQLVGSDDATEAFAARMVNIGVYAVVTEADGNKRVYGSNCFPARVDVLTAQNPNMPNEGYKGFAFELSYYDISPRAPKFTGSAPLIP